MTDLTHKGLVELAKEAAIVAMGWTDPRMVEDGRRCLAGYRFASFGFGGECFLTSHQVEALRRCHDGARALARAMEADRG